MSSYEPLRKSPNLPFAPKPCASTIVRLAVEISLEDFMIIPSV